MSETSTILKEDLAEFVDYLEDKVKRKRAELKDLEEKLLKYKNSGEVTQEQYYKPVEKPAYKVGWTLVQKINYMLGARGKTTTEIVDEIIDHEPERRVERAKLVGSVSAILSARSKPGGKYSKTHNDKNVGVYSIIKEKPL